MQTGGAVDDLTHEEIVDYLDTIEKKIMPDSEHQLESQKEEQWKKLFPYRERYLEFVVSLGDNNEKQVEKYQTMLAELYMETLFKI